MRRTLILPTLLLALPALAAEEAPKGMPQLEFGNPLTVSQVIWMLVIFGALYLLLSRWALPQVGAVLEERAGRIASDLTAAQEAKAHADAAVAELTAATQKARADAHARIATATAEAQAKAAKEAAALTAQFDGQIAAAEARIADAQRAAMGALRQVATDTTQTLVTRLAGGAPDPAAVEKAVDAALAARGVA